MPGSDGNLERHRLYRTLSATAIVFITTSIPLIAQERDQKPEALFEKGELAIVATSGAALKVESRVVANVPRREKLEVRAVNGPWVWTSYDANGNKREGWIHQRHLVLDPTSFVRRGGQVMVEEGKLTYVDLSEAKPSNRLMTHLAQHRRLRMLLLPAGSINDEGIEHLSALKELEVLVLSDNPVSDAGLTHLKGLSRLELVDVANTKVTEQGAAELRKSLPECRIEVSEITADR